MTGQYFDRVDFTDLKVTRVDATVAFNWGTAAPDASMGADNFAVRWTGQVQPQFGEDYTFYVNSDDGARLWVDGRLVVDNWVNQSVTEKSATLPLAAGQKYDVRLDYYDATSSAQATLSWSSPSVAKQVIPAARLFPSPAGLAGTYLDNQDFTGASYSRTDANVDFNWGTGSPAATGGIAPTTYSAIWSGEVVPQYSQTYSFYVTPDAGATAKLWVDRELVFDSTSFQPSGQIQLEAGKRYDIQLNYAHSSGTGSIKLEWSSPTQLRQTIPNARLLASKLGAIPTRRPTYTNSVNDLDRPDPGVIFDGGYYWMTHTTGGPTTGWPLAKSTDMTSWTSVGNMLNSTNKPAFMDSSFWAPEFHKINGRYVVTGTAKSSAYGNRLVIAIGTAAEISGPYTVRSTPIVADAVSVLDSTIFQDFDGRVYLIWKRDASGGGPANGSIRIRELNPADLTSFAAGSTELTLLNNAGGGAWEKNIEEAPEMIHRGAYYYLFYSGSSIDTTYAVGVARAATLTGIYSRYPGNVPILQSNATWGGPGHGAFVQDVDGTWWFYYHARHQDNPSYGRVQMLDKVVWNSSGWPTFGNGGTPSTTPQTGDRVDAASGLGRYTIAGDAGGVSTNDIITVVRDSADASLLDVLLNGATKLSVPFGEIENLTLSAGGGNDTLVLDDSRGECVPGTGINFSGSVGTDVVRIVGASADGFHVTSTRLTHGTGAVSFNGADAVTVQGGTLNVDADLGSSIALEGDGPGTSIVFAAGPQHLRAMTLSGAAARFAAGSGMVLSAGLLAISGGGTLDLAGNDLIIDYPAGGSSPIGAWNGSSYTGLLGLVASGRGEGSWNGSGITTSAAGGDFTTLAVAEASAALGLSGSQTQLFDGQTVDATAVLVKFTYGGDANLDGVVNIDDYTQVDSSVGVGGALKGWFNGDFNYDGNVDIDDYTIIDSNIDVQGPPE